MDLFVSNAVNSLAFGNLEPSRLHFIITSFDFSCSFSSQRIIDSECKRRFLSNSHQADPGKNTSIQIKYLLVHSF